MRPPISAKRTLLALLLLAVTFASGCSYMRNRGNDLLDIIDVGLTFGTEREPGMAVYAQITPIASLGFSNVDAAYIGLADRNAGVMRMSHRAYGILLWGQEARGIGPNATAAEGRATPYGQGIARIAMLEDAPEWRQYADVQAAVHIAWVGINARVKPMQLLDFVTGLFTWDFIKDDIYPLPEGLEDSDVQW